MPAAGEELRLGCDRDGQVVEDRVKSGVGIVSSWSGTLSRALVPSPVGSLACAREQTDGFKGRPCFLLRGNFGQEMSLL